MTAVWIVLGLAVYGAFASFVGSVLGRRSATMRLEQRLKEGEVVRLPDGTLATKNGWTAP
jgi:hypothetical protein